jgi:hypothetical protein
MGEWRYMDEFVDLDMGEGAVFLFQRKESPAPNGQEGSWVGPTPSLDGVER